MLAGFGVFSGGTVTIISIFCFWFCHSLYAIPLCFVTTRRLHDVGKSGWLQLLNLLCCIGTIIVLIMCIPEGQKEANEYGEVPAE